MRELSDGPLPSSPTAIMLVAFCTIVEIIASAELTGAASGRVPRTDHRRTFSGIRRGLDASMDQKRLLYSE